MSVFVSNHLVISQLPERGIHCVDTSSTETLFSSIEYSILQKKRYCHERERERAHLPWGYCS